MITLRSILTLAALCAALGARATPLTPFHGCSFYLPRLFPSTPRCADFQVQPHACPKVRCDPHCWVHAGTKVTGYMPDHFIEVTNRAGRSIFATVDAPLLMEQMATAKRNWGQHGDIAPGQPSARNETPQEGHNSSFFFGRTLPVAYGDVGWSLPLTGWFGGVPAATCFSGITEFAAETWADGPLSGDRELALAWAPFTAPVCGVGGMVMGAIRTIPIPSASIPSVVPCVATPYPAPAQKALAVSAPTAYDPLGQCMGALGGLYPRTGSTEGGDYTAAERVAWRTASMSEDIFRTGVGVRTDDKWQLVWPPVPNTRCFAPGSLLRPSPADGSEAFVGRVPGYDTQAGGAPATEYVFAVWRKRTACLNAWDLPRAEAEIQAYFPLHTPLCEAFNVGFREPRP